ncbi:MAG: aldehyde dehydrogenase family protein [Pseudomonadota bacterium]
MRPEAVELIGWLSVLQMNAAHTKRELPMNTLDVTSPYTGDVIATLEQQDGQALETMLARAYALYTDRQTWLPQLARQKILHSTAHTLREDFEAFAQLIASEGAKPLKDARVEALRAADGIEMCVDHLKHDVGQTIPLGRSELTQGHIARTISEPIGVVAAVSAFNHPLNLIVHQVAPAIAAGCPVIVKPAPDTPLSCIKFVELLHKAGLPPEWCQVLITDDLAVSESLVTDPRLGFFSFIGSARVGWMLRSKLAPGVRCALEHGGAAPLIIAPTGDVDASVPAILKGGYYHSGQVCVSVQRVFVPDHLKAELVEKLTAGIAKLHVGDPLDENTDVGPLIRPGEVDRVQQWVDQAKQDGATLAVGGGRISARVFEPTLIVDAPADSVVSQQEIFGPVVCVYGYTDLQAAINQANDVPFSFQAAVFSKEIDEALEIANGLNGSAIMINEHTAFRDDVMPFAGLKQSGLGVGGIPYTIEDMQIQKMLVVKSGQLK